MNSRIKALMKEAGYAAPELATRGHLLGELVAKDCIDIIRSLSGHVVPPSEYIKAIEMVLLSKE